MCKVILGLLENVAFNESVGGGDEIYDVELKVKSTRDYRIKILLKDRTDITFKLNSLLVVFKAITILHVDYGICPNSLLEDSGHKELVDSFEKWMDN